MDSEICSLMPPFTEMLDTQLRSASEQHLNDMSMQMLFFVASLVGFQARAWAGRKESGTHCLRMLSFPRISGNLEIPVKSAPLH